MCPFLEPNTNAQIVCFFVTSIACICARVCTQLLQPLAQSLIGSPVTLGPGRFQCLFQCGSSRILSCPVSWFPGFPVRTTRLFGCQDLVRRTRFGVSMGGRDTNKKEHICTLSTRTKKSVTRPSNS